MFTGDTQLGGLEGTITKMLEADPNFAMGKVMATCLSTFEVNSRTCDQMMVNIKELIELKKKVSLNERERMHCEAVVQMGFGNRFKASQIWEEILMIYPRDILALKNTFINYIYLGCSVMLRDVVARVLPYWKQTDPEYGYLLNLYAFGLEETNLYAAAEKTVLDGLSLAPEDQWGIHTASHIYESTCRYEKAGDMLLKTESWWGKGALACHNYWHLSNYYVETNSFDKALEVFDEHVGPMFKQEKSAFSIDDGCQLLQKLEFEGVEVGNRWEDVYESYLSNSPDNFLCYHDILKLFSFPNTKGNNTLNEKKIFLESVENYIRSGNDDNSKCTQEIGLNTMKGVVAYTEGCFEDAVDFLYPVKRQFARLGGSNAQRDIFDLLLINACLNSKTLKYLKIGRCLLYERESLKPESPLTERLVKKCLAVHSDN